MTVFIPKNDWTAAGLGRWAEKQVMTA